MVASTRRARCERGLIYSYYRLLTALCIVILVKYNAVLLSLSSRILENEFTAPVPTCRKYCREDSEFCKQSVTYHVKSYDVKSINSVTTITSEEWLTY